MNDSQTVKKTVMLACRVSPDLKKRLAIACAHRDWKVQKALRLILTEWLDREEKLDAGGATFKGPGASHISMLHEPAPGESVEVKRDRRKASKHARDAR